MDEISVNENNGLKIRREVCYQHRTFRVCGIFTLLNLLLTYPDILNDRNM